jgi:hypothetical protein
MSNEWQTDKMKAIAADRKQDFAMAKGYYAEALRGAKLYGTPTELYILLYNFGAMLLRTGDFSNGELMMLDAAQLVFEHGTLNPQTAWLQLVKLYAWQNRLQELEQLCQAVGTNSLRINGEDSVRFQMDKVHIAKAYALHLKDMNKCRALFQQAIAWSEKAGDEMTLQMMRDHFDHVLRATGNVGEADELRRRVHS